MKPSLIMTCIATALMLGVLPTTVRAAETTYTIENFESYSSGVGSWSAESDNISVNLSLFNTGAIEGNNDLSDVVAVAALGGSYVIKNLDLNLANVPASIQNFDFKYKSIGLNSGKYAVVTLRDQSNNNYISPQVEFQGLQTGGIAEYSVPLSQFSPSAAGGVITGLTGVTLTFHTPLLSIGLTEHIDSLEFTWDNSAVADWSCY